jgi:RND family efflux transporter MFP subunit
MRRRPVVFALARPLPALALVLTALAAGCGTDADGAAGRDAVPDVAAVAVTTAAAIEQPIRRFVGVTGTLTAEEQAEVAAEIAGRIVATPVERGSRVGAGAELVRIADADVRAQVQEAEANAAQIEARLGLSGGGSFQIDRVPEVASARTATDLAEAEFDRTAMLLERKLVPQAEFDRTRTQLEAARRQYDIARNTSEQLYQSLLAAQARTARARKALDDTVVRAPFDGLVEQRLVSIGDYVTPGTKVASVIRTSNLRVELTVPGQYLAEVKTGGAVTLEVDAYPGQVFTGLIRYVAPALRAESRALIVEAVVPNETGQLKPGLFATAKIEQTSEEPAVLVPATAVRSVSGAARVYVVESDGVAQERLVTTGQAVGDLIEITSGLAAGDTVATSNVTQLTDGAPVTRGR